MTDKPNLMRVARALAECDGRTQTAFMSLLGSIFPETVESGCAAVEDAGPANNVRFNTMLNRCKHRRQVYSLLGAFPKEGRS